MEPHEIERLAKEAGQAGGKQAVYDTFRLLGIDTRDQRSVNQLRADLISAREIREFKETAKKRFWFVVVGVAALAAISAFWEGLKMKMGW